MRNKISFLIIFACQFLLAQVDEVVIDTVMVDSVGIYKNEIINPEAIKKFYTRMNQLEQKKDCKLRAVHIGDSHIQADMFTGKIRSLLQNKLGNGGLGFSFPYNLAKTNGNYFIKYTSNASFEAYRNIYKDSTQSVGLSGIGLTTKNKDFAIQISVRDKNFLFNTIKVLQPKNESLFDLAIASKEIIIESAVPKIIVHKIKSGESLSGIATKYNSSIEAIKSANKLRSNAIIAGKSLKIPTDETQPKTISRTEFIPLALFEDVVSQNYYSKEPIEAIYLIPKDTSASSYALNGLIVENNQSGVVYSAIGVNGAKAADYNRFPLFFEQLKALEVEFVVISLGTNESFDKKTTEVYFQELQQMLQNIRNINPGIEILLTTPPPSFFSRKYPNTFVADYSKKLIETAVVNKVAIWDMFQALGGLFAVNDNYKKGLMSKDKVHYSKAGYELQGQLFFDALMTSYEQFKAVK